MADAKNNQKGMATILVAIVLVVIVTLMVIFATRVGIFDQRMSANEVRYKEAFAIAEAGLDITSQRFATEFKRLYDGQTAATANSTLTTILTNSQFNVATEADGTVAEVNEPSFTSTIIATGVNFGGIPVYTIESVGIGGDGSATATLQRQFTMANVFNGSTPDVPIIVGGAVGTGGNFNVTANPNKGGPGVPVSIWAGGSVAISSSSATCHSEFYDGNNAQCSNPSGNSENISRGTNPATAVTAYDPAFPDVLPNDPNFPSDMFNFVFGLPRSDYQVKKAQAAANGQVVNSCADIISAGQSAGANGPLWWVTGPCDIQGNNIIGTESQPVILVIENNLFKMGGGKQTINGIVYLFDDDLAAGPSPSAQLGGSPEIVGSFISDIGGNAMQGSYSVVYNPVLNDSFNSNGNNYDFAYVPGSWRDF